MAVKEKKRHNSDCVSYFTIRVRISRDVIGKDILGFGQ